MLDEQLRCIRHVSCVFTFFIVPSIHKIRCRLDRESEKCRLVAYYNLFSQKQRGVALELFLIMRMVERNYFALIVSHSGF